MFNVELIGDWTGHDAHHKSISGLFAGKRRQERLAGRKPSAGIRRRARTFEIPIRACLIQWESGSGG